MTGSVSNYQIVWITKKCVFLTYFSHITSKKWTILYILLKEAHCIMKVVYCTKYSTKYLHFLHKLSNNFKNIFTMKVYGLSSVRITKVRFIKVLLYQVYFFYLFCLTSEQSGLVVVFYFLSQIRFVFVRFSPSPKLVGPVWILTLFTVNISY